jgi:hypothetical protein
VNTRVTVTLLTAGLLLVAVFDWNRFVGYNGPSALLPGLLGGLLAWVALRLGAKPRWVWIIAGLAGLAEAASQLWNPGAGSSWEYVPSEIWLASRFLMFLAALIGFAFLFEQRKSRETNTVRSCPPSR